jgi:hypothetical protein
MFDHERCAGEILQTYRHILYGEPRPEEFTAEGFLHGKVQKKSFMTAGLA